MKTIINVECMDQELVITNSPVIASGGVHENFIAFNFCEKWDGLGKTAVFYRNEKERFYSVLGPDDVCEIPHEVTDYEGIMYFGVYGEAGEVTKTSKILRYKIVHGAMTTLLKPSEEPTPDIYQQLLSAYGLTNEKLDKTQTTIDEIVETLGYVTPEMFGGIGDGLTDDTKAIQSAIDYATTNNKIVKIPSKEYGVKQIKIPSYAKIIGENWRLSTLKSLDSVSMIVFKEDGVKQFHISNINLDGNNVGAIGINFHNSSTQKADTFGVIENISVRRMKQQGIILGERVREMRITNAELYGNGGSGLFVRGCSDSLFNFITSRSNNGIGFEVKGSNNRFISCKAFCNGSESSKKVGFDVSDYENAFVGCASQQNTNHGMYIHDAKHITVSDFSADANGTLIDKAPETPFASGIKMYNSEHIIISAFATDFLKDVFGLNQKVGITVEACRYFSINLVCRNMITDYVESSLVDYCERDVVVNGVSLAQNKVVNKNNPNMYRMEVVSDTRITDSYRKDNNGIDLSYYVEDNSLRIEHINDNTRSNIINANNNSIQIGNSSKKLGFYGGTGIEKQQIVSNATDLDSAISLANNIKQILLNMNLVKQ